MDSIHDGPSLVCRDRFYDITTQPSRMLPPIQGYQDQPLVSLENAIEPLINTLDNIEQKVQEAKRDTQPLPADNLSVDESASIRLYTMEWEDQEKSLYYILNMDLRSEDRTLLKKWFRYLRLFMHALLKIQPTYGEVYRGVNKNLLESYKQGQAATWWAFSSCTTSSKVLKTEAFLTKHGDRTRFEIHCFSGRNICKHSSFPNENEVLLLAASYFRISSCRRNANGLTIIKMQEREPPFMLLEKPPEFSSSLMSSVRNISKPTHIKSENDYLANLIRRRPPHSTIDLNDIRFTDQDMPLIVNLAIVEKQCTKLSLRNLNIGSEGISILASGLHDSTTLEELDLSGNDLSDDNLLVLINAIQERSVFSVVSHCFCFRMKRRTILHSIPIRKLYLTDNMITDKGVRCLIELIESKITLIELWLSHNRISNDGMELFARTLTSSSTHLERLYLNENQLIDDASSDCLLNIMKNNTSLKCLSLTNCSLSHTKKNELKSIISNNKNFSLML